MSTPTIDERFNGILQDVSQRIGSDRVADILDGILIGAAKTKGNIEKSVDALLVYTSLPSRSEHEALVASVDALSKKLNALTRRVEELAANGAKPARKRSARRATTAAKPKAGARKASGAKPKSKTKAASAKAKPARGGTRAKKKPSTRKTR